MKSQLYTIGITAVTIDNCSIETANHFVQAIKIDILSGLCLESIQTYPKFEGALKIELRWTVSASKEASLMEHCQRMADQLATPWIVLQPDDPVNWELLFNAGAQTSFSFPPFQVIRWCLWQVLPNN